jgi:hypothetical protein
MPHWNPSLEYRKSTCKNKKWWCGEAEAHQKGVVWNRVIMARRYASQGKTNTKSEWNFEQTFFLSLLVNYGKRGKGFTH